MKKTIFIFLISALAFSTHSQTDKDFIQKIYNEALENGQAYENLRYLCKNIGARLSGSAEAEMAVQWSKQLMDSYGFDKVYLQEIEVPHWERGTREAGWIISNNGELHKLNILALGGSIATTGILEAELIHFATTAQLRTADPKNVKGKIVYLSQPFDQTLLNTFEAYGVCGTLRWEGPILAAQMGAVAVVIRSLGSEIDHHPHTGSIAYNDEVQKIPAAAISTADSELLNKWVAKGTVKMRFSMDCRWLAPAKSHNVVAEITGKNPNHIITFGGHLDSWDVGEGAHDDGAGVMHSLEALRILKKLGYKPNYTLRCVFFMNEENGNFGGLGYADYANQNKEVHVAAIESDRGGFLPLGFDVDGSEEQLAFINEITKPLQRDFKLYEFEKGYSGVDIRPLKKYYPNMLQLGVVINSQEYFKYHHTAADVFETVDRRELHLGCAAMAAMIYLLDKNVKSEVVSN